MKIIEVVADAGHLDTLRALAEEKRVQDLWWGPTDDSGRQAVRLLVADPHRQAVLDILQGLLSGSEGARVLVQPVEAVLPRTEASVSSRKLRRGSGLSREELYDGVASGAQLDRNFLVLVVLSTVVAGIGMVKDNVAVVIGAMVIAPWRWGWPPRSATWP